MLGRLPLVEQLDGLRSVLSQNEVLTDVMTRAATLELPGWYVTAGCLFQTVWNVVTGRPPTSGIKDYDIFCFDGTDLSWESRRRYGGLGAPSPHRRNARQVATGDFAADYAERLEAARRRLRPAPDDSAGDEEDADA
jgi:hypothetical protein